MRPTSPDFRLFWSRWHQGLSNVFRHSDPQKPRAEVIANLLHECLPTIGLTACRLDLGDTVVPKIGLDGPAFDREEVVKQLAGMPLPDRGALQLQLGKAFGDLEGIVVAVGACGSPLGFLLLGLAPGSGKSLQGELASLLTTAAQVLALHLELEKSNDQIQSLKDEHREFSDLITAAEALAGLIHQLNNCLNSMTLQASVIQLKVDESLREELSVIRREGARAAAWLRPLQQFREQFRQARAPLNVNDIVGEVLYDNPEFASCVGTDLSGDLPTLSINRRALKRLLVFLLRLVISDESRTVLKTIPRGRRVELFFELVQPGLVPGNLNNLLEREREPGGALNDLELFAVYSLVRWVGGDLRVEQGPHGASVLILELSGHSESAED
jgi:hypothetical protein